jgi:hypothetical protein
MARIKNQTARKSTGGPRPSAILTAKLGGKAVPETDPKPVPKLGRKAAPKTGQKQDPNSESSSEAGKFGVRYRPG